MEMRLHDVPFQQIKDGIKTVEMRLNDEKRQKLKVGNYIDFVHTQDDTNRVKAKVVALHYYSTFKALLSDNLFDKCGCNGYTVESAAECMYQYYAPEQERLYGVVGIKIELVSGNQI